MIRSTFKVGAVREVKTQRGVVKVEVVALRCNDKYGTLYTCREQGNGWVYPVEHCNLQPPKIERAK